MGRQTMDLRTGAAFWPINDGLIGVYPPLERDERCDVAIIGAGITGALAAHRLTEAGCDVVVLDRNDVGMGSTAAQTGLLQCETDTSLGELAAQLGIERAVRSWRLGLNAIDDLEIFCADAMHTASPGRPSVYLASTRWDVREPEGRARAQSRARVRCRLAGPAGDRRHGSASRRTARFKAGATQKSMRIG